MPTIQEARAAFKGQNLMTPRAVEYGWVSLTVAYEISEGTGFEHEPIFGLTFRRYDGTQVEKPRSMMFYSMDDVRAAIAEAKRTAEDAD